MSYQSKDYKKRNGFILAALGAVLTLVPMTVGFMSAGGIYGQSAKEDMHQQDATCVFAGKHYPEGAVIHQEGGHEQLCAVSFNGSMWVRTSPEIRQRGQSVVEVAVRVPHVPFCTPKESTLDKKLCSCEEGGVYSPGSIVDSARGRLSCTAGLWNPTRTGK